MLCVLNRTMVQNKGKIIAHFITMLVYTILGVFVIIADTDISRKWAGGLIVTMSILGFIPLVMWWNNRLAKRE